jgi:hypothetical protein
VSGSFGLGPPRLGGEALSDRFDVVTHMSGLRDFASEYAAVRFVTIDGVSIPLLPLRRIADSKRAAARSKDQALLHALEDALALLDQGEPGKDL